MSKIKHLARCFGVGFLLLFVNSKSTFAQTSKDVSGVVQSFLSSKNYTVIKKRFDRLQEQSGELSDAVLRKMKKKERALVQQVAIKDSVKAKQLDEEIAHAYSNIEKKDPDSSNCCRTPELDSLNLTIKCLLSKQANLTERERAQLTSLSQSIHLTNARVTQAAVVQDFLKERQQQLSSSLTNMGLTKELTGIYKTCYYYKAQVKEWQETLKDKDKLTEKILGYVRDIPAFKTFIQQNSYLSRLFGNPSSMGNPATLAGMQTRAQLQTALAGRLNITGNSGPNISAIVQQQVQSSREIEQAAQDKINNLTGSKEDFDLPDFKPDHQKHKSFLKRLELGYNLQTVGSNRLLPALMDIGLSAGYKLNDRSTIGIGGSYKLGLGRPIKEIELSMQGVGLRSFIDMKLKGSIWLTGGYEYNYITDLQKLSTISDAAAWQKSGLLGLTKKIKIGKRETKMQLLWDFLSYSQVPRGQAIKFRIGSSF